VKKDQCYKCPANSHNKNSKFCGQSFQDTCSCDWGYTYKHGKCVYEETCFQCPKNSHEKNSKYCGHSFHDTCSCDSGYFKEGHKCVKEKCHNDYVCPKNSYFKHGRECYTRYIAHLDSATGSETMPFGALELTDSELIFFGAYDNDSRGAAFDGHKIHIHNEPVASVGDCASTGGHYDPTGVEIEGYSCDPSYPETCYVAI